MLSHSEIIEFAGKIVSNIPDQLEARKAIVKYIAYLEGFYCLSRQLKVDLLSLVEKPSSRRIIEIRQMFAEQNSDCGSSRPQGYTGGGGCFGSSSGSCGSSQSSHC